MTQCGGFLLQPPRVSIVTLWTGEVTTALVRDWISIPNSFCYQGLLSPSLTRSRSDTLGLQNQCHLRPCVK